MMLGRWRLNPILIRQSGLPFRVADSDRLVLSELVVQSSLPLPAWGFASLVYHDTPATDIMACITITPTASLVYHATPASVKSSA